MRGIIGRKLRMKYAGNISRAIACVMICAAMLGSGAALAQGRDMDIPAQLSSDAASQSENYTAEHFMLGESAAAHDEMIQINSDYAGWLSQEGTVIDYPIAQGDDNKLYLDHTFQKESAKAGCLFLDYRNSEMYADANNMIYGHHMKDGSMLASLTQYTDQAYYDAHPTMNLYTPYGDYVVELFAGVTVSGENDFLERNFATDEAFNEYWKQFIDESTFKSDVTIERGDRIISLVTCTYEYDNARYIVCGKLTPVKLTGQ